MDDLNTAMFRAYDIRTPAHLLTDPLATRLVEAEAVYFSETLGAGGVLLAHDARSTGPHYLDMAAQTFARCGLDVLVVPGVCSTSQFYFAAMQRPELAAVMCGASHNPAGDTGQKVLGPGVQPIAEGVGPEGGLDRIKALYVQGPRAPRGHGTISAHDPTEDYIRYSMHLAGVGEDELEGVPILHDYLYGAAGREMMLAFTRAGAALTPLHFAADGRFPLGDPNPVKQAAIREGLQHLASGRYLLATFFDGDGDRMDVYCGDGTYLASSFVYAAVLPYIAPRFPTEGRGVYADLKANPLAVMEMARSGVRVDVIRNGHSQIKAAMLADPLKFGTVEESAHFYEAFTFGGKRFCTENTLYMALLLARAWQADAARFEALVALQARTSRQREWGYKFATEADRQAALDAVERHFAGRGAETMSRMPNGYELEATMMRRGLPFEIGADTRLSPNWLQVCQRVSQSENGLARWEVVAATPEIALEARGAIAEIVARHGAGAEYQG